MKRDAIDQQLESSVTRRRVIGTGVKLAYAAPVVAASFKLNHAAAQGASPLCRIGTCDAPNLCGPTCGCRDVNGVALCLQQSLCDDAPPCPTGSCPAGFVCLATSCCDDGGPRCVTACTGQAASETIFVTTDTELVLGTGIGL
jgi:hypothetical protein